MLDTPIIKQKGLFGCGLACSQSIALYYGHTNTNEITLPQTKSLRQRLRLGASLLDIKNALASHQIDAQGFNVSPQDLRSIFRPFIAHLKWGPFKHFVVVTETSDATVSFMDPGLGKIVTISTRVFYAFWTGKILIPTHSNAKLKQKPRQQADGVL